MVNQSAHNYTDAAQMNAFSLSSFAFRAGARGRTCSTCRAQLACAKPARQLGIRAFATAKGSYKGGRQAPKKTLLFASASTATLGASFLAFSDEIKSGYESTERTARVASALAVCINE